MKLDNLETEVRCLFQVFKPTNHYVHKKNVGDCTRCIYDKENNPKCNNYYPIPYRQINVISDNNEKTT